MDEAAMLKELKLGSQKALDCFIKKYAGYVSTVVSNIIGDYMTAADIEEVSSDVFFAMWRYSHRIRSGSVKGWLGCVARNMAKNKLRQQGRDLPLEEDVLILDADMESRFEKNELAARVKAAVMSMDWPDREIFLRHYYYCQKVNEIGREMNINPATVKTKLRRGREWLKRALSGEFCE